jgi:hypothetical protein
LILTSWAREDALSTKFDAAEAEIITRSGTGSIGGQALKTLGGEVRYAAGNSVLLVPVTAYFREAEAKQFGTTNAVRRTCTLRTRMSGCSDMSNPSSTVHADVSV